MDPNFDLRTIATACNGYVGADLEALCREATFSAIKRTPGVHNDNIEVIITNNDWEYAKSTVGPSITRGVTVDIPKVSWEDIGGLRDLKV